MEPFTLVLLIIVLLVITAIIYVLNYRSDLFIPGTNINKIIGGNKVVVFSKSTCPYCVDAKNLLQDNGIKYKEVQIDKIVDNDRQKVIDELRQMTSQNTVPNIFINGKHIGGFSELKQLNLNNL